MPLPSGLLSNAVLLHGHSNQSGISLQSPSGIALALPSGACSLLLVIGNIHELWTLPHTGSSELSFVAASHSRLVFG